MLIILFGDSTTTIQYSVKKNGTDIQVQDGDTWRVLALSNPISFFSPFFCIAQFKNNKGCQSAAQRINETQQKQFKKSQ